MLLFVRTDPVDSSVSSDCLVEGVDEDYFEEFVSAILTYPVGVENSEVSASSANSLLSNSSVRSGGLELIDTLVDGLSVDNTLANWLLSSTSSNSDSVDHIPLLSLISELSSLVGSR